MDVGLAGQIVRAWLVLVVGVMGVGMFVLERFVGVLLCCSVRCS